jgi:hypothetical protein
MSLLESFQRQCDSAFILDEILRLENLLNIFSRRLVQNQHEAVSKSLRTGRLERELQMVQLSAARCSFIAILWVSLLSFAAITLCVASQRVFIFVVYFVIDSVRKRLDTLSYFLKQCFQWILSPTNNYVTNCKFGNKTSDTCFLSSTANSTLTDLYVLQQDE